VIGGSVFVTSTVPPNSLVTFKPPELRLKTKGESDGRAKAVPPSQPQSTPEPDSMPDYAI